VYFYANQLKDIWLEGNTTQDSKFTLHELTAEGHKVARFEGVFPDRDPRGNYGLAKLDCEVMIGTWRKLDAAPEMPFYLMQTGETLRFYDERYDTLGGEGIEKVNRGAQRFWTAVKTDDKNTVASAIKYPVTVRIGQARKRIRNAVELVARYDAIFAPKFKAAVVDAMPRNMRGSTDGYMLGRGEVWFDHDGRVIALNN
jgi:hypothetical protein